MESIKKNDSSSATVLPIVDLSALFGDDVTQRAAVANQIGRACREFGFFYVTGQQGFVQSSPRGINTPQPS